MDIKDAEIEKEEIKLFIDVIYSKNPQGTLHPPQKKL
jgi:hypothetical protein